MKQECYFLMVFTNEIIYSLFSAMTAYAWETNWTFTNGENRVHLVNTHIKLGINSIKNEKPDMDSDIARTAARLHCFS